MLTYGYSSTSAYKPRDDAQNSSDAVKWRQRPIQSRSEASTLLTAIESRVKKHVGEGCQLSQHAKQMPLARTEEIQRHFSLNAFHMLITAII